MGRMSLCTPSLDTSGPEEVTDFPGYLVYLVNKDNSHLLGSFLGKVNCLFLVHTPVHLLFHEDLTGTADGNPVLLSAVLGVLEYASQAVHGVLKVIHGANHANLHALGADGYGHFNLSIVKLTVSQFLTGKFPGLPSGLIKLGVCVGVASKAGDEQVQKPFLNCCLDLFLILFGKLMLDH